MPRGNKRKTQLQAARDCRTSDVTVPDANVFSDDEYEMDIDDEDLNFKNKLSIIDIGDVAEMCMSTCDTKCLGTLLYMSLRFFDVKWEDADEFLKNIGLMTAQTSHKWAEMFIKGNYEEFSNDMRGGKQNDSFYDIFPEIEADAKAFVVQECSKKSAEFKAADLAEFINEKYFELTGVQKTTNEFVRSERSCRMDLRRWGAKFEANSQRPYFEGHERDDVVKHRNEFINYFLTHKDFYYTITDTETPMWNIPTQTPSRILICKFSHRIFFDIGVIKIFSIFIFASS